MMALAPTVVSPTLASADKSFHSEAIHLAFPEYAALPFEDQAAPPTDASAHRLRFTREVARWLVSRPGVPGRLLNRTYVLPRLALGAVRPRYAASHPWLPSLALYLFQLGATAAGKAGAVAPYRAAASAEVPDVFGIAPPTRRAVDAPGARVGRRRAPGPAAILRFDRQRSA
jgi:hypothetical protein